MSDSRELDWQSLSNPGTTPEELARIAAEYPEFREQIAAHPNAYPELLAWLDAERSQAPDVHEGSPLPRQGRPGLLIAAIALGVVVIVGGVFTALAVTGVFGSSGSASSANASGELVGEARFTGDELEWLIVDPATLGELSGDSAEPASSDVAQFLPLATTPKGCGVLAWAAPENAIAFRGVEWDQTGIPPFGLRLNQAHYDVYQLGSIAEQTSYLESVQAASEDCGSVSVSGSSNPSNLDGWSFEYEPIATTEGDGTIGLAGILTPGSDSPLTSPVLQVVAGHGNAVIWYSVPVDSADDIDADAVLDAIASQVQDARDTLGEELSQVNTGD